MPKISAQKRALRREEILVAAKTVFIRRGFAQSSIAEIAAEAGVSDGMLYRYFSGLKELMTQVLEEFYSDLIAQVQKTIDQKQDFSEKLRALVEHHLRAFNENPGLCLLFIREVRVLANYAGSSIEECNRQYTAVLTKLIEVGQAQGDVISDIDPRLVRDLLFGGIEHIAFRHLSRNRPIMIEQSTAQIIHILLAGLKASK